jgi:hypothetical protein
MPFRFGLDPISYCGNGSQVWVSNAVPAVALLPGVVFRLSQLDNQLFLGLTGRAKHGDVFIGLNSVNGVLDQDTPSSQDFLVRECSEVEECG